MHNRVDELLSMEQETQLVSVTMDKLMEAITLSYEDLNPDMEKNRWTIHNLNCVLEGMLHVKPELTSFVEGFTSFLRTL